MNKNELYDIVDEIQLDLESVVEALSDLSSMIDEMED